MGTTHQYLFIRQDVTIYLLCENDDYLAIGKQCLAGAKNVWLLPAPSVMLYLVVMI